MHICYIFSCQFSGILARLRSATSMDFRNCRLRAGRTRRDGAV